MLNIEKTMEVLNGSFRQENGTVDKEYFNISIALFLDNNEALIHEVRHTTRPIYRIVWQAVVNFTNTELKNEHGNKYAASNYHIKKWLEEVFKVDYKMALQSLVAEYEAERAENNL